MRSRIQARSSAPRTSASTTSTQEVVASQDLFGPYKNDTVENHFGDVNDIIKFALLATSAITSQRVVDDSGNLFAHRTINLNGVLFDEKGERLGKYERALVYEAVVDLFKANGKFESNQALQSPLILPWAKNSEGAYKSQIRVYMGSQGFLIRAEPYGTVDKYDVVLKARFEAYARGEEFTMAPKDVDPGF